MDMEESQVVTELVMLMRAGATETDLRAFPFVASPHRWGAARVGHEVDVYLVTKSRAELCNRYRFALGRHGFKLLQVWVCRDPAKVGGWIGDLATDCAPMEGCLTERREPPPGVGVGLVPVIKLRKGGLNGTTVPADEVQAMVASCDPALLWSSTQDTLLGYGPPAVTYDVLTVGPWVSRNFQPVWNGFHVVARSLRERPGLWKQPVVVKWMVEYLSDIERAVVAFGTGQLVDSHRRLTARAGETICKLDQSKDQWGRTWGGRE